MIRLIKRCRIAGTTYRVGQVLNVRADRLRVASHLVRTGAARPADKRTAVEIELFARLQAVLPK